MGESEQRNILGDIILRREPVWFAPDVDIVRVLVYPHVVNGHGRRECQVFEINESEIGRDSQVEDHVLRIKNHQTDGLSIRAGDMQKNARHVRSALVELVLDRCPP